MYVCDPLPVIVLTCRRIPIRFVSNPAVADVPLPQLPFDVSLSSVRLLSNELPSNPNTPTSMSPVCSVPVVTDGVLVAPSFSTPDSAIVTGHDDDTSPISHDVDVTDVLKLSVIVLPVVSVPPFCRVV